MDLRPTSDRLRETLFDVLAAGDPHALNDSVWVDFFAGTGAVGIEALSRGAAMVYFVESAPAAAQLIQQNLESLQAKKAFRIMQRDARRAMSELQSLSVEANFIFLDPPYRMREAYRETLQKLADSPIATHALIIVEHEKRFDPGEQHGSLIRLRKLEQGGAALSFYRRQDDRVYSGTSGGSAASSQGQTPGAT